MTAAVVVGFAAVFTASAASADDAASGKIAFEHEGGIWVMDADGSDRHEVADSGTHPTWSPDGSRIAFERSGAVIVTDPTGRVTSTLTDNGGRPAWSPDGSKLAFVRRDGTQAPAVWVVGVDGAEPTRVSEGLGDLDPTWSPDGSKLAFARYDSQPTIIVAEADGDDAHELASVEGESTAPAWSPTGSSVAFQRKYRVLHEGVVSAIWVVAADGSDRIELKRGAGSPAWSPDGANIAYDDGRGGVWSMDSDGSGSKRLADGAHPAWGVSARQHENTIRNSAIVLTDSIADPSNASAYGQQVTAKASVTVPGADVADGAVEFARNGQLLSTVPLVDGAASIALPPSTAAGTHTITATYVPTGDDVNISSQELTWTVRRANSAMSVTAPSKLKINGQGRVAAAVKLASNPATGVYPPGQVQVFEGKKALATGTLSAGQINVALPRLAPGKHSLRVQYLGSTSVAATSSAFSLTIVR